MIFVAFICTAAAENLHRQSSSSLSGQSAGNRSIGCVHLDLLRQKFAILSWMICDLHTVSLPPVCLQLVNQLPSDLNSFTHITLVEVDNQRRVLLSATTLKLNKQHSKAATDPVSSNLQ